MSTRTLSMALCCAICLTAAATVPGSGRRVPAPDRSGYPAPTARTWQPGIFRPATAKAATAAPAASSLPFVEDFSDGDACKANYTIIDIDNDAVNVSASEAYNTWFWKEDEALMQYCVDSDNPKAANDWLMTPAIHLDGTTTYKLDFGVNMGAPSNLRVTIGKSLDPTDHKELLDLNNINEAWPVGYNAEFTVDSEGDYYIGFYNYSSESSRYFNLFSIEINAGGSALAPNAPQALSITPDPLGALGATISFTAPDKMANGTELPADINVDIYRNEVKATTLACKAGEECSWHDNEPEAGENTYRVNVCHNGNEGKSAEVTAWIGTDIPKAVSLTTLTTTNGNMSVVIGWDAVTEGLHGPNAYFNPDEVSYIVYRGYNRNDMEPIATDIKDLTYTDTEIGGLLKNTQDGYFYGVAAVNEAGATLSSARIIAVGKPYEFPAKEAFPAGRFDLNPWLTDPIAGSFSWELLKSDSGFDGHDNRGGLIKYYSAYGGENDSRLKSPVFTLKGTDMPMFSLWMYHWDENAVAADYGATKLLVEVSVDGGPWQTLGEPLPAGYAGGGWMEHKFLLADFMDAGTIQFGLRGQTDNSWMYFYVDDLHFEESYDYDLCMTSFYGDASVAINGNVALRADYLNRGSKSAKDYSVELYRDDVLMQTLPGQELAPGETGFTVFNVSANASMVGTNTFTARINFEADENTENDMSGQFVTKVDKSSYPTVTGLAGKIDADGNALLTWEAPILPERGSMIVDGAEDYEPFAISDFGNWMTVDRDQLGSGYIVDEDVPLWPNCGTNQAFMVWCPDDLTTSITYKYPQLTPYEGRSCFIAWMANVSDWWNDPVNDDFLISSEVTPGTKVKFMIKGATRTPFDETFELMYSSTDRNPESFTSLYSGTATEQWTPVEYTLPDDAVYFYIHYTASLQMALMVDNIEYSPVDGCLELVGYDVFRNNTKLNEQPLTEPAYLDTDVPQGTNTYSIAAIYDRGTSNSCESISLASVAGVDTIGNTTGIEVTAHKGSLTITSPQPAYAAVYSLDGKTVFNNTVAGTTTVSLPSGIYIVKTADKVCKVAL